MKIFKLYQQLQKYTENKKCRIFCYIKQKTKVISYKILYYNKRTCLVLTTQQEYFKNLVQKEHPFKLIISSAYLDKTLKHSNSKRALIFKSESNYNFFLDFYGLNKYFFLFSLILWFSFIPSFFIPTRLNEFWFLSCFFLPIIIYCLGWCFLHIKITRFKHSKVLNNIWKKWSSTLDAWSYGLVQKIIISKQDLDPLGESSHPADIRLKILLNKKRKSNNNIYSPSLKSMPLNYQQIEESNMQERFHLLAMIDFFSHKGKNNLLSKGYLRWLGYWMAPIWLGYICIFLPIIINIVFPCYLFPEIKTFIIPLFTWIILSSFFMWKQIHYLKLLGKQNNSHWELNQHNISFFPITLYNELKRKNDLSDTIEKNITLLSWIYGAAITIYIFLLNFTNTHCKETPSSQFILQIIQ